MITYKIDFIGGKRPWIVSGIDYPCQEIIKSETPLTEDELRIKLYSTGYGSISYIPGNFNVKEIN